MDKTTRTILLLLGGLLLLCACATAAIFATGLWSFGRFVSWADRSVSEDPLEVVRVGAEIADFEAPEGFGSPYGVHFGDISMVGYSTDDESSFFFLAQFPEGTRVDTEEMLKRVNENPGGSNHFWSGTETMLVEQKPVSIRGQESTLNIREGTSEEGIPYRVASATFQGSFLLSTLMM